VAVIIFVEENKYAASHSLTFVHSKKKPEEKPVYLFAIRGLYTQKARSLCVDLIAFIYWFSPDGISIFLVPCLCLQQTPATTP